MSDLISRSALIEEIKQNDFSWLKDEKEKEMCIHLVKRQPVAYDTDKVVERLEATKDVTKDDTVAEQISTNIWNKALSRAIRIVKGGGISE